MADPKFEQVDENPSTTADPTLSTSDGMALVPMTTLTSLSTKANGKDKEDNDDKEKDKPTPAPKPAPVPAPAPAPAPTTAPTSTPSTPSPSTPTSGSLLVPAFWMDVAHVTTTELAACVEAKACAATSCTNSGDAATCVTRAQATAYCTWRKKRLVRDAEWTSAAKQDLPLIRGLSGGVLEWVDAPTGTVRGGTTSSASGALGLDSSMPTVGFRCARDHE